MRTIKYLAGIVGLALGLLACEDDWNNHYSKDEALINNTDVTIVSGSSLDYIRTEESYSSLYKLFEKTGVLESVKAKKQPLTILALSNDIVNALEISNEEYWAKTCISDVALSPSSLTAGQRILMWNGKYLSVGVRKPANEGASDTITINDVRVNKIIKTDDGYIYEMAGEVSVLQSMYEIIQSLGDDYSDFRKMLSRFNKEASTPIGVDETGNTIYDSVFVVTSPAGFDLTSESVTATMLIPSNDVIRNALNKARQSLAEWKMTRADTILENWVYQSVFFAQVYSAQDFAANEDLTSVYEKQWRTTVQKVDLDNPVQMSNGVAYYITEMKIPTNVLIYRLKDLFNWYEFLTESEKDTYFDMTNLLFKECKTDVVAWSGWPGVFPYIENRITTFDLENTADKTYVLNFTPFRFIDHGNGTHTTEPYLIPPGEYNLCMGFKQNTKMDVEIGFDGTVLRKVTTSELSSANWHYDRGGQGYPEGYDVNKATDKKKANYDRDGVRVTDVVVAEDNGKAASVVINLKGSNVEGSVNFYHWCLRPTKNNY